MLTISQLLETIPALSENAEGLLSGGFGSMQLSGGLSLPTRNNTGCKNTFCDNSICSTVNRDCENTYCYSSSCSNSPCANEYCTPPTPTLNSSTNCINPACP